jgi:alkylhydroperoxidase family enzyme
VARHQGVTEEKLAALHDLSNPLFTDEERAALEYASAMAANKGNESEALVARTREFFDEAQLVELSFFVATLHGLNLFNNMLGIEPEDQPMVSMTAVDIDSAAD